MIERAYRRSNQSQKAMQQRNPIQPARAEYKSDAGTHQDEPGNARFGEINEDRII